MILRPFEYIDAVARHGSIRVAADHLHVAPSAISRHIKNLEDELGVPLFDRHARGVTLTQAGEVFVKHIRSVLLDRERVRSEIDDIKGIRRGHIRVHTIDGVAAGPLAAAISTFRSQFPGITFHLFSAGTATVIQAVKAGDADVGVAFEAPRDSEISTVHRIPDPLHAVVSTKHPLAKQTRLALPDLQGFPVALPEASFGIRMLIDDACRKKSLTLKLAIETNSIDTLRGFASSGAGVTALPLTSSKRDVELGLVKTIPFKETSLKRAATTICVRRGRILPPAAVEFISHLHRTLLS